MWLKHCQVFHISQSSMTRKLCFLVNTGTTLTCAAVFPVRGRFEFLVNSRLLLGVRTLLHVLVFITLTWRQSPRPRYATIKTATYIITLPSTTDLKSYSSHTNIWKAMCSKPIIPKASLKLAYALFFLINNKASQYNTHTSNILS